MNKKNILTTALALLCAVSVPQVVPAGSSGGIPVAIPAANIQNWQTLGQLDCQVQRYGESHWAGLQFIGPDVSKVISSLKDPSSENWQKCEGVVNSLNKLNLQFDGQQVKWSRGAIIDSFSTVIFAKVAEDKDKFFIFISLEDGCAYKIKVVEVEKPQPGKADKWKIPADILAQINAADTTSAVTPEYPGSAPTAPAVIPQTAHAEPGAKPTQAGFVDQAMTQQVSRGAQTGPIEGDDSAAPTGCLSGLCRRLLMS